MLYGQNRHPAHLYNSQDRATYEYQYSKELAYQQRQAYLLNNSTNLNQSPYLASVGSDDMRAGRYGNAQNIIRRSKNFLNDLKNQNSGY